MLNTLSWGLLLALAVATLAQDRHSSAWRDQIESDRAIRQGKGGSTPAGWMLFIIMAAAAVVHRACVKHAPVNHAIDFAFRERRPEMLEDQTTIELSGLPRGF